MSDEERKAGWKRFCEYNARRIDALKKGELNHILESNRIQGIDWKN